MTQAGSLLLVNDEETNRDMLARRLEIKGYSVTSADNGVQALALVERYSFDLVLLDVMMPDLNGLEVLSILRRQYTPAELPVIMVTARDQSSDVVEVLKRGSNDYVTEPLDLPVVLARIATQVSHKRAQAALRESEARFALVARGASNGLWYWDLQTDKAYYSSRWKAMLGHEDTEIGDSPEEWLARSPRRRRAGEVVRRRPLPAWRVSFRVRTPAHAKGSELPLGARPRCHRPRPRWFGPTHGGLVDRHQRGTSIRSSDRSAQPYPCDGPARAVDRTVETQSRGTIRRAVPRPRLLQGCQRQLRPSDRRPALDRAARRLEACLRKTDTLSPADLESTVARLGGDEFIIITEGINDVHDAIVVAERIQHAPAAPFHMLDHNIYISASIGIALNRTGCVLPQDVLRDADTAMYGAKDNGKARYVVFDSATRARTWPRRSLDPGLHSTVDRRELRLP